MDPTTFVITSARVVMETHPHDVCRVVEPHYDKLVGLSIARGLLGQGARAVRRPARAARHITALLLAMAPVAVQSMFSMQSPPTATALSRSDAPRRMTDEHRARAHGLQPQHLPRVGRGRRDGGGGAGDGEPHEFFPLWAKRRLAELGLDDDVWRNRFTDG